MSGRPLLALAFVLGGCATVGLAPPEIDPRATFAAYRTSAGFTIARAEGGGNGVIAAAGWSAGAPAYRVRLGEETLGELRAASPGRVEMRAAGGEPAGDVEPSWDDGAIRIAIRAAPGPALRTRSFRRVGVSSGLSRITRNVQTTLDLRGDYRGELYDPDDRVVGWLEVRVWEPSGRRVYEGVFPDGYPALAAAAAAVALDSELEWIRRWAYDVNRGATGGIPR